MMYLPERPRAFSGRYALSERPLGVNFYSSSVQKARVRAGRGGPQAGGGAAAWAVGPVWWLLRADAADVVVDVGDVVQVELARGEEDVPRVCEDVEG